MNKLLLSVPLILFGLAFLIYWRVYYTPPLVPALVVSPTANTVLIQGEENEFSWEVDSKKEVPFTIIYLLRSDNDGPLGVIGTTHAGTTQTTWTANTIRQGDVVIPLEEGRYKLKIMGYDKNFCYSGECAPGSPLGANELFEAVSEEFEIREE